MKCPGAYVPTRKEKKEALKPYEGQDHDIHWHSKFQQFYCLNCDLSFWLSGTIVRQPDGTWTG